MFEPDTSQSFSRETNRFQQTTWRSIHMFYNDLQFWLENQESLYVVHSLALFGYIIGVILAMFILGFGFHTYQETIQEFPIEDIGSTCSICQGIIGTCTY